jgi:Protein of unknown function (DUF3592)
MHDLPLSLQNAPILAAAALGCGYALIQIGRALLARRWPTVEGEIVDARMVRLNGGQDNRSLDQFVTYRYHVDGRRYTSNRVRFGLQSTPTSIVPDLDSRSAVADLQDSYPRGKPVRVYYNPRRPAESVLYPTPNLRVLVLFVAGLWFGYAALHGAL